MPVPPVTLPFDSICAEPPRYDEEFTPAPDALILPVVISALLFSNPVDTYTPVPKAEDTSPVLTILPPPKSVLTDAPFEYLPDAEIFPVVT